MSGDRAGTPPHPAPDGRTAAGPDAPAAHPARAVPLARAAGRPERLPEAAAKPQPGPAPTAPDAEPPAWRARAARALLGAFALAAAADLAGLLAGSATAHHVAKPLLMPLLAAYVFVRGGPRLLAAALLFGWGGDVLLLFDAEAAFLAGMGCFAAGHVCFLVFFARCGRRSGAAVVAGYAALWAALMVLLWPGLEAQLRIPLAGYSLLLTAMAVGAAGLGSRAAAGGALFLLSDTLIATGLADWPQLPVPDFWIMLTYAAAQYLLARGLLTQTGVDDRTVLKALVRP